MLQPHEKGTVRSAGIKPMPKSRAKMPLSQRAKIFAPFDALTGLRQALKEKEKIRVPRKEISEDMAEEIDRELKNLEIGKIVTVVWYNNLEENYIQLTGECKKIDVQKRFIQIEKTDIYFDNIYSIC